MKKLLLVAAVLLTCAEFAVPRASAQTAQFVFSPISFPAAAPGSTISFSISLLFTSGGTINNVQGATYFLQQNGAGPFVFTLMSRDLTGSLFVDPITNNPTAIGPALDPSNDSDLGALSDNPMGSGTYFLANITLAIAPGAAPGVYTIQTTTMGGQTSVIANSNGTAFPVQPGSLTVTVVPEPATLGLLTMGGIGLGLIAYRRCAAKA